MYKRQDKDHFEANALAYFASVKKGVENYKEAKQIEGDILRYKASGTMKYKGVEYLMDVHADKYKHAVFYNLLYKGDEDKKLLNAVLATFHQRK